MDTATAKRRSYHPTPAWLVWGAAVATGVLFACERWRWFPVNYQKGWPVLLAVAVVVAVLVLLPAWMLLALVFRRRVQFSLRTMLVFVTLCAVVCSWITVRIKQARRQAERLAAFEEKFGATVSYDWMIDRSAVCLGSVPPSMREPLGQLLGVDFFADVEGLSLGPPQLTDAEFADLALFTQLRALSVGSDHITEAGLSHLGELTNLRNLWLMDTKATDKGVKNLQSVLPRCKITVQRDTFP